MMIPRDVQYILLKSSWALEHWLASLKFDLTPGPEPHVAAPSPQAGPFPSISVDARSRQPVFVRLPCASQDGVLGTHQAQANPATTLKNVIHRSIAGQTQSA